MTRIVRVSWLPTRYGAMVIIPRVILVRRGYALTAGWMAHELAHIDQIQRLGLARYWLTYAWQALTLPYGERPLEVEADAARTNPQYLQRAQALIDRS